MSEEAEMSREIRVAARWWADALAGSKQALGKQIGVGPDEPAGGPIAGGMFAMLGAREAVSVTDEAVAIFRVSLERALRDRYAGFAGQSSYGRTIATDYHPDAPLSEALSCAGLNPHSMTLLPLKTVMWVDPGRVAVAAGYGAQAEELPVEVSE